jgi:hypothetical protein
MTWTDIPTASLEPGTPIRSADSLALRDNIAHVRDGNNKIVVFTTSGTYSKPTGLARVKVTVLGGGGGGGGSGNPSTQQAGGGGSGGYSIKVIEAASLGASETVTVGAGGVGGSSTSGGAGGTSSFGAHCSATGGAGGIRNTTSYSGLPVNGGAGSGGNVNASGHRGGLPFFDSDGGIYSVKHSGDGADSLMGMGGVRVIAAGVETNGNPASGYGAGGSGAHGLTNYKTGGAGEAGIVIVEEFY